MSYIDLHVHSNASDGTLSPAQVVRLAARSGLAAIALTDHDTVDGVDEALAEAGPAGIQVIPGVELSCVYQGHEIHILGLFVRHRDPALLSELNRLLSVRIQRNEEMLRRFQEDGFSITMEELTGSNPDTVITRAHFARVLVDKGYAPTMDRAFKNFLQYGGRYCLRKELITPELAMRVLTANGAFPALAHPCQYKLGWKATEELAAYLAGLGMKGLEVYHSSHNQEQSRKLKAIAAAYGLLPTGGSDFHGANKPDISIGTGRGGLRVSSLLLEDIRRAMGM